MAKTRRKPRKTTSLKMQQRFADNILRGMARKGITQHELAQRTQLADSTISRLLNGLHAPAMRTCVLLAAELDLDPATIFADKPRFTS
jgi:transcriptional regulator with XRE-family HTH domain